MPLPTERITLNAAERRLMLFGLNRILNGVAELFVNGRRSPEMLLPSIGFKYQPRQFSDDLYQQVLHIRNVLQAVPTGARSKHRFDCIDLAIIAFAVRVHRSHRKKTDEDERLDAKLESYRKCAKRACISRLERQTYDEAMHRWHKFRNWVRFTVLPLRVPRAHTRRRLYREQREQMLSLAKEMVADRCAAPVDDKQLERLVVLAIREIRRSRHGDIKVRSLLANPAAAREFLFAFIRKRIPDRTVRHEYRTLCEQAAVRTEKFRAFLIVPEAPLEPSGYGKTDVISEKKVVTTVAQFFKDKIPRDDWDVVKDQVAFMAGSQAFPALHASAPPENLGALIAQVKPEWTPSDRPDDINFAVEWLVAILLGLNATRERAARLVREGWALAVNGK